MKESIPIKEAKVGDLAVRYYSWMTYSEAVEYTNLLADKGGVGEDQKIQLNAESFHNANTHLIKSMLIEPAFEAFEVLPPADRDKVIELLTGEKKAKKV